MTSNNALKPAAFALYIMGMLCAFMLGAGVSAWMGVADDQGLAGAAIVLFYGLITALAALVVLIFIARKITVKRMVRINWVLLAILVVLVVRAIVLYEPPISEPERDQLTPTSPAMFMSYVPEASENGMGMGLFKPDIYNRDVLYFYGEPNFDKAPDEHFPIDSAGIHHADGHSISITFAPPWLVPEHLKMDYEVCLFKILAISRDWVMVEGNKSNGQITWLDCQSGEVLLWSDFLLGVHSVEFKAGVEAAFYLKPLKESAKLNLTYDAIQPVMVRDEWMLVRTIDADMNTTGRGWLEWRNGKSLLVNYHLLS
ncbi:MAG: hypothetical protein KDC12_12210 [Flavobacteriales bacterium]|nr:hypothetical protein [Flavobacteriales bacterium]